MNAQWVIFVGFSLISGAFNAACGLTLWQNIIATQLAFAAGMAAARAK